MGYRPPPLPPTEEELQNRWKAGARTPFELDPALGEWYRRQRRFYSVAWPILWASATILIIAALASVLG